MTPIVVNAQFGEMTVMPPLQDRLFESPRFEVDLTLHWLRTNLINQADRLRQFGNPDVFALAHQIGAAAGKTPKHSS